MSDRLIVFRPETGEVTGIQLGGHGGDVIDRYRKQGEAADVFAYPSFDMDAVFIHSGRLRKREPMLCSINKTEVKAIDNEAVVIQGAPLGATVTVRHGRTVMQGPNDGSIKVFPSLPGLWTVDIEHIAYVPQHFEIIAV